MKSKLFAITIFFVFILIGIPVIDAESTESLKNEKNNTHVNPLLNDIDWWPMYQHDLIHTGLSSGIGPDSNEILWKYKTEKPFWIDSPPVVFDNMVYVGVNFFGLTGNHILCLDSDTGNTIWSFDPCDQIFSSPSIYENKLYIALLNSYLN